MRLAVSIAKITMLAYYFIYLISLASETRQKDVFSGQSFT